MSFASPNTLLLLLIILPLVWYIGYPRYAFRRQRDITALVLRTILFTLIVFALAGIQIVRQVDRMAVVFLVDASDSIGTELRDAQVEYIQNAVQEKPVDDEWAIIVFGANTAIDTPFLNVTDVPPIQSTILSNNTNIEDAIQTAISLFPADARRRIVVLSDGIQTIGNAEAKARLAEASGVEISYVLFARPDSPDVRISEFTSPARVNAGQEFDINITIESDEATSATLLIYSGNELIDEADVTLLEGSNSYTLRQVSEAVGRLNFSAQLLVDDAMDTFLQNNTLGTFSQVMGQPRVLLLATDPLEIANLQPALEGAGLTVDVIHPSNLSPDLGVLAAYESVIIANVSAVDLPDAQMRTLQQYVRDLGGGLVFVGGPDSYGPGGYFGTTLEEVLPIQTQIHDQERLPSLTITYLIDSSGSMGLSSDGIFSNLDLEKRAVNLSISFLQPTDRVAVLTFEARGAMVAPYQDVNDGYLLQQAVNSLGSGGGTDILAGLLTAEGYLVREQTDLQHLILMTDGGASSRNLVETAQRLYTDLGVTMSVIAIGSNNPRFLREMAEVGGGNFHDVQNVAQIPNILAQETVLATRSYIQEGEFAINRVSNNPMLDGIGGVPQLQGYVATGERSTAQVVLRSPEPYADPILATWQYGLGRATAFTSDATGRWAGSWVGWSDFSRFWGQVVNYSITGSAGNNIETRIEMIDEVAYIAVDARSESGAFINNLNLQTSVIAPDGQPEILRLQQTAPGQYTAEFEPRLEGSYYLAINGRGTVDGEAMGFNEITGWVMSYSPEYAITRPDEALLDDLAVITGGRDLAEDPAGTFVTTQAPRRAAAPIWQWMVLGAMILLPFDIAVRRLIITRRDLKRLRIWVSGIDPDSVPEARITSLMAARDRAREKTTAGERDMTAIDAMRRAKAQSRSDNVIDLPEKSDNLSGIIRKYNEFDIQLPENTAQTTVSNLLKRRRRSDDETGDEAD